MGRVAFGIAEAENRVSTIVRKIIDELALRPVVFEAGLDFNIGSAGKRLSLAQRQKLALARAILRRPDLLMVNRGLMQLDVTAQSEILSRVLRESQGPDGRQGFGLLWNLENAAHAHHFNRVITMENGKISSDQASEEDTERDVRPEPMRVSA